ncbi:hypothetical protein ACFPOI_00915 [Nonomuraea angiospora]|uniref:Uncharacterized protein n=1 Tax=Nonomuraea angiospora TaxID=46172 RepID=A0ABR9M2Y4_9ACTN|nr:hypothetical protein [Nonomuraea angiospora]MBE1586965.1 hypothetical protein [Nonomuraea angiospora]
MTRPQVLPDGRRDVSAVQATKPFDHLELILPDVVEAGRRMTLRGNRVADRALRVKGARSYVPFSRRASAARQPHNADRQSQTRALKQLSAATKFWPENRTETALGGMVIVGYGEKRFGNALAAVDSLCSNLESSIRTYVDIGDV